MGYSKIEITAYPPFLEFAEEPQRTPIFAEGGKFKKESANRLENEADASKETKNGEDEKNAEETETQHHRYNRCVSINKHRNCSHSFNS